MTAGDAGAADTDLIVQTPGGRVRGTSDGTQNRFLNIPFGQAPIGPLRWRPTQPAGPWTGVLDGTKYGNRCPQFGNLPHWNWNRMGKKYPSDQGGKTVVVGDEDCLNLNVYAPLDAQPGGKLPVMVYLFPGGDEFGDNRWDVMFPLVREGVIVVAPNYRIGVFGFMAHPQLTSEGGGTSPNYGLYDQVEALRWVRDNIAAFGGDPGNVTLFGGSAGAFDTMSQLTNPMAQGLFQRAIVSSAADQSYLRLHDLELWGQAMAQNLGCGSSAVLECLRKQTFTDLNNAYYEACGPTPLRCGFSPVIDGITIADTVADYLRTHPSVPLMVGHNWREYDSFLVGWQLPLDISAQDFANNFNDWDYLPWFGPQPQSNLLSVLSYYPLPNQCTPTPLNPRESHTWFSLGEFLTDEVFTCNANAVADSAAQYRQSAGLAPAVYRYLMAYDAFDDGLSWLPRPSSPHMLQQAFFLQRIADRGMALTPDNVQLEKDMTRYWVNFARNGDPNGPGLPTWPVYELASKQHLELNTPIVVGDHYKERECVVVDPLRLLYAPFPDDAFAADPPQNACGFNDFTLTGTDCSLGGYSECVGP
jgi:para-nitrobenzyl esterase